ncbi:MAG: hypothetical protein J6J04_05630 [Oscillospiraceae bacterium]|nr:hypothetical protein [Oscillospiraceae bacterium]
MKYLKRVLSFALALCTAASLVVGVHAADETETQDDARFKDKTWEEVMDEFMTQYGLSENNIAVGYMNLVTGEEHYIAGDTYMVAASMYKVPLNMVYTERISKGEMTFDDKVSGVAYSKLMQGSIVESNNEFSDYLRAGLGGYPTYRRYFCEYMGEDPDTVSQKFYENNYFTARQMITCLHTLHEGGEDRFPKVIEYMKQAEPNNYFNAKNQKVTVAHKYGYLEVGNRLEINDCGICYTTDPIAIVMFTLGVQKPYTVLSEYCALMIDYTEYNTAIRLEEEARREAEEARQKAEQEAIANLDLLTLARQQEAANWTLESIMADETLRFALYLCAAVVIIAVVLTLVVAIAAIRKKIKALTGIVSVWLFALAMLVCIIGPNAGNIIAAPTGEPQEVVVSFFEALQTGDYETAYSYLDYYSSLGLENEPNGEAAKQIYEALRGSYSYRLYGDCVRDGLTAKQQVLLDHLDIQRMQTKLGGITQDVLEEMVQTSANSVIYDENDQFRPEVTEKAYQTAVAQLLEMSQYYQTTTGMELDLVYTSNGWKIQANDALLHALCGGTAY